MRAIVTVIGQDRTGIVAGVSTRLTELDVNIIDISQTIMDGFFTMNRVVEIEATEAFPEVKTNLEALGESLKVDIKIMNEAIEELKENEFKELYADEDKPEKEYVKDLQIDTDFELLFSDEYINNISERLNLYNELSLIKDEDTLSGNFELPEAQVKAKRSVRFYLDNSGLNELK